MGTDREKRVYAPCRRMPAANSGKTRGVYMRGRGRQNTNVCARESAAQQQAGTGMFRYENVFYLLSWKKGTQSGDFAAIGKMLAAE